MINPEGHLWRSATNKMQEVQNIFYKLKELKYSDKPDYNYIKNQLRILLQKEEGVHLSVDTGESFSVI